MTGRNSRGGRPEFETDLDVRHLPTRHQTVTGRSWFVHWEERAHLDFRQHFRLRPERGNRADKSAVGVWLGETQVGYLFSGVASEFGALLRLHATNVIVEGGLQKDEIHFWLKAPRYKALRSHLKGLAADSGGRSIVVDEPGHDGHTTPRTWGS